MQTKDLLGIVAVIIGLAGYASYFRNIFLGKTKPHAFSWLIWGILTGIAFAGQVASKAGAGAWVTGMTAFLCLLIFLLALKKGSKSFPLIDWISLVSAGLALGLWAITNNPLTAIILVTFIDLIGFVPTFRKSYSKPSEETLFTYAMSGLKFVIGIIALQEISWATALYPASLVITNGLFITMCLVRRKQLA